MEPAPTLVIMAAGAARRYGGLKQLAPVGPDGEAIMEYSIHDAAQAGFGKVVLVVREEFEPAFRDKFVDRVAGNIDIAFAHQEPQAYVPPGADLAAREKPWGTAHAVLCARTEVAGPFAVINADDFYGPTAIAAIGEFLADKAAGDSKAAAMVAYPLSNTLSDHGTVNRGICQVGDDGRLADIVERFKIARTEAGAEYDDPDAGVLALPDATVVSMNLWGFPLAMLDHLERRFTRFAEGKPDASTEFELPTEAKRLMAEGLLDIHVLSTDEKWCGMTYQEDLPIAQSRLAQLVEAGIYPNRLY